MGKKVEGSKRKEKNINRKIRKEKKKKIREKEGKKTKDIQFISTNPIERGKKSDHD